MKYFIFTIFLLLPISINASEMTWGFKNPAFHYGNGYSTHVLSVEQLGHNRKEDIRKEAESEAARIERELENSTLNKFIRNIESRIYAQLSKQIADQLFGEDATGADTDWVSAETPFGDTVRWKRLNDVIFVEIYDSSGDLASEFQTPVGDFAF